MQRNTSIAIVVFDLHHTCFAIFWSASPGSSRACHQPGQGAGGSGAQSAGGAAAAGGGAGGGTAAERAASAAAIHEVRTLGYGSGTHLRQWSSSGGFCQ